MNLKTYIAGERGRSATLAARLEISPSYLSQMASGTAPISPKMAVRIWRESDFLVTRQDMFPDTWVTIWPELAVGPAADSPARSAG